MWKSVRCKEQKLNYSYFYYIYVLKLKCDITHLVFCLRFEAFTVTECNEVFSGDQLFENLVNIQRFGYCLYDHHHQILLAREDFFSLTYCRDAAG
jgi:hypothetical protein